MDKNYRFEVRPTQHHQQGKTWDRLTIPKVRASDLDSLAFRKFRDKALLDSLMLIESEQLTRAAVLLFHENPERYVFGAYVKIGHFETDADLLYQDEVHGPLITMPDRVMETIYLKYFKGIISYEGLQRIETFPVPRPALREAVLNAIVHRDYTTGIPIQIKIFRDRVIVYNDGRLPESWTVQDLLSTHRSRPYNPMIANTFFRSGFIETWGRGIERITTACQDAGKPVPLFEASPSEIKVTFYTDADVGDSVGVNIGVKAKINENQQRILRLMRETPSISAQKIADTVGITKRRIEANIRKLKESGLIERVGSDKSGHWVVKLPK